MTSAVKCLKCGGDSVRKLSSTVDRKSGKRIGWLTNLVVGGIAILTGGICTWTAIDMARLGGTIWVFVGYFIVFGGPMLALGIQQVIRYIVADRATLFRYNCVACGHRWEQWEEGWDSVSCQKCGESVVTTQTVLVDPETRKPPSGLKMYGGLLAILIGIGAIGVTIPLWLESALLEGLFPKLMLSAAALGFVSWGVRTTLNYFAGGRARLFKHHCAACNHEWERLEGEKEESTAASGTPATKE